MPSRQQNRSGLTYAGRAGYEWQDKKVSELKEVFGETRVRENPQTRGGRPGEIRLDEVLPSVEAYQFIVEGEYEADTPTFRQAIGLNDLVDYYGNPVGIGATRPDVIQVLPSMSENLGPLSEQQPNPYELLVQPNGEIEPLADDDPRLRLRVIDIKLTSEPGAYYFAEVVYYSMTLAAWLIERGFDDRFVVVAAPAVWPGRHDASELAHRLAEWRQRAHTPTGEELVRALEEDLELAVFDIFAPRLRQLLTEDLPNVLERQWPELAWHVDYRCKGCEFLGYPWSDQDEQGENHELRCWPTAERERNLSRVYGLSRGASEQLRLNNIPNIDSLADELASSNVFNQHQGLRTRRTAFPHRAEALRSGGVSIVPDSGGDALMPRWPSLHIYLFIDYDLSSSITAAMAIRAFWREPLPFGSQLEPQSRRWSQNQDEDEIFLVDRRDLERERREFLRFLRQLAQIIDEVRQQDDADANARRRDTGRARNPHERSTYQIYLWDESQHKQLVRMISRHLPYILTDSSLHELIWLFPPPELLQEAEDATRQSAITLVKPVVENTVALDVPHYYRLLDLAERVTPSQLPPPSTHPLYEEPLSDLIPMERLHEYWNQVGNWLDKQRNIIRATRAKVYGLSLTVSWLERQLSNVLSRQAAPPIIQNRRAVPGIAPVSRLLLGFTRLNAALDGLEAHTTRAMPPHEREARLRSARLERRLEGQEKQAALEQLNQTNETTLIDSPKLFIYRMRADSCEVNLRRGDFLFALAPEAEHGFLDINAYRFTEGSGFEEDRFKSQTVEKAQLTAATVVAIDRVSGRIALRLRDSNANLLRALEQQNRYDFSHNVILDPVHKDFLTKKVEITLKGIGNPPSANNFDVLQALRPRQGRTNASAESPASEILWCPAQAQQQPIARNVGRLRQTLDSYFTQHTSLNESQWRAWEEALTRRLTLFWGPPGTGKSRTLRAVTLGAALDARARQQPLRLLITANTYNAIDNVLLDLETELRILLGENAYVLYRVQSKYHENPPADWTQKYRTLQNLVLNRARPSQEVQQLRQQLESPTGIIIIGCPPQQLHNLSMAPRQDSQARRGDGVKNWFDLILLDEASQMDVATSTLVFSKLAANGACVLAGDDLQLPPIHQAEPPEGLEYVVGSVYNFYRHHHGIEPQPLNVNYRSNRTITEFTRMAGYSQELHSYSPDLQLDFSEPIGILRPDGWPDTLYWTSDWKDILDPMYPAVSFVYDDVLSSQVNDFEADTVAALIWLLRGRLKNQLLNERSPDGAIRPPSEALYETENFWSKAVGVATPHRAQMAKVVRRLREVFPNDRAEQIYGAVDTVERYQGQQRDVIIASFGIGDPDLIQAEDEFLYSLNRFNVLTSRARAKVIVLLTQSLLQHLSNDIQVLKESRLLKRFVESYCLHPRRIQLGYLKAGQVQERNGVLRRRSIS